jgi:hypothetical protein
MQVNWQRKKKSAQRRAACSHASGELFGDKGQFKKFIDPL